jgi:hypothetical protein
MFKNEIAEFIYKRTYSRWRENDKRREDWSETIERFLSFLISERKDIPEKTIAKTRKYLLEFSVMPFSGRQVEQPRGTTLLYITALLQR